MIPALVLISAAIFCALILNLAAKPKITRGLAGAFTFIAAAGGLCMYGVGYAYALTDPIVTVLRTLFSVCRMFAGVNELGAINATPLFDIPYMLAAFWLLHFMAFYATASATISTIGASALKRLKYWLQRYGKTVIVYGVNDDSIAFGRTIVEQGTAGLIFVDDKCDPAFEKSISSMGCLYRDDKSALAPNHAFLRSIGSHKGTPVLYLYAMQSDDSQNMLYARQLLAALEDAQVDTANAHLIMRSNDDVVNCELARTAEKYGYGDVKLFSDAALTARMLIQEMPPYSKLTFDAEGRAEQDFDAVIVGFGRTGSEILRYLVRNAQFEGSTFHAAVFTPNATKENGFFCSYYPGVVGNYDIRFYDEDGRSKAFYDYLKEHSSTLRYVVICTGSEQRDREIWQNVTTFLQRNNNDSAICRCSSQYAAWSSKPGEPIEYRSVYKSDRITSDRCDKMAMHLNYSYVSDPSQTPEKAWAKCDYFSRESSRAAVDFVFAFAAMTGTPEDELMKGGWTNLTLQQKENLGKTEHRRWCAFHYTMGFLPMDFDTVAKRGEVYKKQVSESGRAAIRVTKDLDNRLHACLCDWDRLDALAELEEVYTGKRPEYKEMDIGNVLALPEVLRIGAGDGK